jgi:4-coumarate--CoA ligase
LEILQFVNSKLAHFKHIRGGIVFVDAVPKDVCSPSGKILRRVIKVDLAHKKPFGETFPKRSTDSKL